MTVAYIENLGLTDEDRARRRLSLGGSDANTIMSGNAEWIHKLWLEKTGQAGEPDEVQLRQLMGHATEDLNAAWYEHVTGDPVTDRQKVGAGSQAIPMHATLDGLCHGGRAVWEAKHTGGYDFTRKGKKTIEIVAEDYFAQLQHNMIVMDLQTSIISVFFDNSRHEWLEVAADPFYQAGLMEAEAKFWQCVMEGTPPAGFTKATAPKVSSKPTREDDMSGNNEWGDAAAKYLETLQASSDNADALKTLKGMVADDAAKAFGNGVMFKRDARGALRVSLT